MKSSWVARPNAAEFPHDNALIDRGALWIGSALCGVEPAVAVRKSSKPRTIARIEALAPPMRTEPILPPPMPAAALPSDGARTADIAAETVVARLETVVPPAETAVPRRETIVPPAPAAEAVTSSAEAVAPPDERIETFVRTISEVARAHGPAATAAHVESLFKFGIPAPLDLEPNARAALVDGNILEATDGPVHATAWFTRTSSAWQNMLRGDGGNLAECGESTLDGFAADLIARLVAKPDMAATIRRELRRRGIAAFRMPDA